MQLPASVSRYYQTVWREHQVGELSLRLLQLEDFEKSVDDLIARLQAEGQQEIVPEDCPYFGQIWSASDALARLMAGLPLQGCSLLEVGCGLALPALVAASRGATVQAFDIHPHVEAFLEVNAAANGLDGRLQYRRADWRTHDFQVGFDYVIGSDILYEKEHPGDLCRFLQRALAPGGTGIFIDPCRWHHQEFHQALQAAGFAVTADYSEVREDGKPVRLYTMIVRQCPSSP